MSPEQWKERATFRAAVRRSLYFTVKSVICADKDPNLMTERTFKEPIDWLQQRLEGGDRALFEDPRNHAKSHCTSIGIPIWVAVQRPHDYCGKESCPACDHELQLGPDHPSEIERGNKFVREHPHLNGPDARIAIASETANKASDWVETSTRVWKHNEIIKWAFPELIWPNFNKLEYGSWGKEGYFLPGRKDLSLRDAFLRALGTTSKDTGGRIDILIIDDLVSEESARSAAELRYRSNWVRSISQQLQAGSSCCFLVTNRWALDDPNSLVHDVLTHWHIWSRAAWVCGVHGRGNCGRRPSDMEHDQCTPTEEPLWPELWSWEAILEKHADLGDELFYTQWGNRPTQKAELRVDDLRPCDLEITGVKRSDGALNREWCITIPEVIDPETRECTQVHEVLPLRSLHLHAISIDPAGAEDASAGRKAGKTARWAVSWFALDKPTARVFWIDLKAAHWGPGEAIERAFNMWLECSLKVERPLPVLCERVAAQTLVYPAMRLQARDYANNTSNPHDHRAMAQRFPQLARSQTNGINAFHLVPPARGTNKDERIRRRLGWRLQRHKLYLRTGIILPRIEIRHFPTGSKDALDTEAQFEDKALEHQGVDNTQDASRRTRMAARRRRVMQAGITGA